MTGNELDVIEGGGRPPTLFGPTGPTAFLGLAGDYAAALKSMLVAAKLIVRLDGREYVKAEGWTALGSMLGVFPIVEHVTEIVNENDEPIGFSARAVARTRAGETVGAAEAICTRDEPNWNTRRGTRVPEYALYSMAQTRAVAKALRMPLGFIISMAGYQATPAEEMPADAGVERGQGGRAPTATGEGSPPTGADASGGEPRAREHQLAALFQLADRLNETGRLPTDELIRGMEQRYGTSVFADLSQAQAHDLIERLAAIAAAEDEESAAYETPVDMTLEAPDAP